jgi:hypothetical protein
VRLEKFRPASLVALLLKHLKLDTAINNTHSVQSLKQLSRITSLQQTERKILSSQIHLPRSFLAFEMRLKLCAARRHGRAARAQSQRGF